MTNIKKIIIIITLLFFTNQLFSQYILVQKQKLNRFINVVQYIQNQKTLQQQLISQQDKQIVILNDNIVLLNTQIIADSTYIENLNKQINQLRIKKWYQDPLFTTGVGYIIGTVISIILVKL